jgi:hypothetical protein
MFSSSSWLNVDSFSRRALIHCESASPLPPDRSFWWIRFMLLPFAIRPPLRSEIYSGHAAEAAFALEISSVTAFTANAHPFWI